MARVKRAVNAQKKRRTTLERASGYRGQRSRLYRKAKEQVTHSLVYSYNDRRKNKGNFRRLWIQRINAASRAQGMTYNRFIQGLGLAGVEVDRKVLADLAVNDIAAFNALVEVAKAALPEDVNAPRVTTRPRPPPDLPARASDVRVDPGQGGTQAQPSFGANRAAAVPRRRPEGRRGAPSRRPAASSRSSRRPRPRSGTPRWPTPARADVAWALVDERALASLSDSVTPAGVVARLPLPGPAARGPARRAPAARRRLRRRARPGQRRDGHPLRRRCRRRPGRARRDLGRPPQPQDRPGQRRQPVPPPARGRARRRRRGLRAPARRASRVLATAGDGEVSLYDAPVDVPTAWLFGNEAHGLPDDLAALADHRVVDPDPRPRREPQPLDRRRAVPLRVRSAATARRAQRSRTAILAPGLVGLASSSSAWPAAEPTSGEAVAAPVESTGQRCSRQPGRPPGHRGRWATDALLVLERARRTAVRSGRPVARRAPIGRVHRGAPCAVRRMVRQAVTAGPGRDTVVRRHLVPGQGRAHG